jgi:hypothetical protein
MLIALNIVLATAVVTGMVALFVHAIRSERRHHQLQAEASHGRAAHGYAAHGHAAHGHAAASRPATRRIVERHLAAGRPARSWRRDGEFSASRG